MNIELLMRQNELVFAPLGIIFTESELVALGAQFDRDMQLYLSMNSGVVAQ